MPGPTISEIKVDPNPVLPGQKATIVVVASDPDGRQIALEAEVVSGGQIARKSLTFTVSDPLAYSVSTDIGVLEQDPSDPAVFHWSTGDPS